MVRNILRATALLLTLSSGPVMADSLVTLRVSPEVALKYQKFQKLGIPGYMAISPRGMVSDFGFCRDKDRTKCDASARKLALDFCMKANEGESCILFSDHENILYQGKVNLPSDDDLKLLDAGWKALRAEMTWEGQFEKSLTWLLIPGGEKPVGWVKFSASEKHSACFGGYSALSRTSGRWVLSCAGKLQATGDYKVEAGTWISTGKDLEGKAVIIRSTLK